jgi:hypothetical protein
MWDPKPLLNKHDGKPCPDEFLDKARFAFIKGHPKLLGHRHGFQKWGRAGVDVVELLPHIGSVMDDLLVVKSMTTDQFNHAPAEFFLFTGSPRIGRPAMGSWACYGLGSENKDLPGFVVLVSGNLPSAGKSVWGSGFLPSLYQGVQLRSQGDPVLFLPDPPGVDRDTRGRTLAAMNDLNRMRQAATGNPETDARIAQYELAFRMQLSVPEAVDIWSEPKEVHELYGTEPGKVSLANNCLLARRLVERGVRFVQLYHTDWDHHADLGQPLDQVTREVDQPTAALIRDLKQRGLLENTLVIWGGEFGRTPMGEVRDSGKAGRNHHIDAFTLWMAGGGVKPGQTIGETDEFGFSPTGDRMDVHDFHATMLRLLGLDHTRLTTRFQGRDFRLTDVSGRVLEKVMA